MAQGRKTGGRDFKPGNPGRPVGAADKLPRTAKRAVEKLLEDFGNNVELITSTLRKGLSARPPASFPYLKMVVEQQVGQPELPVAHKVVFEDAPSND